MIALHRFFAQLAFDGDEWLLCGNQSIPRTGYFSTNSRLSDKIPSSGYCFRNLPVGVLQCYLNPF
jgi:hypothetical protein